MGSPSELGLTSFFLPPLSFLPVFYALTSQDPTAAAVAASDAAAKMASPSPSGDAAPAADATGGGPASLAAELKARHASLRASRAPDANEVLDVVANAIDAAAAAAGAR